MQTGDEVDEMDETDKASSERAASGQLSDAPEDAEDYVDMSASAIWEGAAFFERARIKGEIRTLKRQNEMRGITDPKAIKVRNAALDAVLRVIDEEPDFLDEQIAQRTAENPEFPKLMERARKEAYGACTDNRKTR